MNGNQTDVFEQIEHIKVTESGLFHTIEKFNAFDMF